jgi:hypothetical protein
VPAPSPGSVATRRFTAVQAASLAVKIGALLLLLVLAVHYLAGS